LLAKSAAPGGAGGNLSQNISQRRLTVRAVPADRLGLSSTTEYRSDMAGPRHVARSLAPGGNFSYALDLILSTTPGGPITNSTPGVLQPRPSITHAQVWCLMKISIDYGTGGQFQYYTTGAPRHDSGPISFEVVSKHPCCSASLIIAKESGRAHAVGSARRPTRAAHPRQGVNSAHPAKPTGRFRVTVDSRWGWTAAGQRTLGGGRWIIGVSRKRILPSC